jgi:hypothetical protein
MSQLEGAYYPRMRSMRRIALLGSFLVLLAAPSGALGSVVLAPPGHDGANQYVEVIPTSSGNALPPGTVGGSGSATVGPSALSGLGQGRGTDAKLATLGKDGQAAAALAASTAPATVPDARQGGGHGGGTGVGGAQSQGASDQGSVPSGLAKALAAADAGGLGLLLPLLLVTALLAVLGLGGLRLTRRTRASQPGG